MSRGIKRKHACVIPPLRATMHHARRQTSDLILAGWQYRPLDSSVIVKAPDLHVPYLDFSSISSLLCSHALVGSTPSSNL